MENSPVGWVDPIGLLKLFGRTFSIGVGGTLGIFDVNWNSINPTTTTVSLATPQIGGGFNFCLNADKPKTDCEGGEPPLEEVPLTWSAGMRYLGISFTDNFDSICLNVGPAVGPLPINVAIPLFSF